MADLATTAPPTLAPNVLVEVGLADRMARLDSVIGPLYVAWNGLGRQRGGVRRVRRDPRGPDRATGPPRRRAAAAISRGRSTGGSAGDRRVRIDLDLRGTASSSATSGARPSTSRAARSGRTAGSPPRSAGRRRSGRSGRRSGTTPCRSSSRATASSGRTAPSGSTRWAVPRTSGRSSPRRASTPTRWRPRRARGDPLIGCASTHIVCWPTCHAAERHMLTRTGVPFRSLAQAAEAGYRPCRDCRPASGAGRWRPDGAACAARASRRGLQNGCPTGLGQPARLHSTDSWTSHLCQRHPSHPPERSAGIWLGMLVLYLVWGSTYLGDRGRGRDHPAVPHGRRPLRRWPASCSCRGRSPATAAAFAWPTRREWRDSAIVGGLLLGGGMGMVAFGEQTIPSGITALLIALMPVWVAVFGGRGPRRAAAAARRSSGSPSGSLGVGVLVGPSALGGVGRPRSARARGDHALADLLVARVAVRLASCAPAAPAARRDRARRCSPAAPSSCS